MMGRYQNQYPSINRRTRRDLVKIVRDKAEKGRIAVSSIRHDANDELKKLNNDGSISEDDYHRALDSVQDLTNEYIEKIDILLKEKEAEIMEV